MARKKRSSDSNRYERLIEAIFFDHFKKGVKDFTFSRGEIVKQATKLRIELPKNLGDLLYSFRYRAALPEKISKSAPRGHRWVIEAAGRGLYRFVATDEKVDIVPSTLVLPTKVPDATPGIIARYALSDEQALLAKLRYNRLVDIFTHVTCYSLQSHLRTTAPAIGQIETDEIYVGIDKRGAHYVFPVQAKGGRDKLNIVQVQQDFAMCEHKFPTLICRAIAAQFIDSSTIALFELQKRGEKLGIVSEKHYQLVPADSVTDDDLKAYRNESEPIA